MESLGLIVGHLIGDYIVQNDWMQNKVNPYMGKKPFDMRKQAIWRANRNKWWTGHLACTIHCLLYTLAVLACSFWWMPWWGLLVCFVAHWPVDRFRLAGWWMRNISGQRGFADGPLKPWSIVIVDNVYHVATLFVIGVVAFKL